MKNVVVAVSLKHYHVLAGDLHLQRYSYYYEKNIGKPRLLLLVLYCTIV